MSANVDFLHKTINTRCDQFYIVHFIVKTDSSKQLLIIFNSQGRKALKWQSMLISFAVPLIPGVTSFCSVPIIVKKLNS